MSALLIETKNKSDLKFLQSFVKRLGMNNRILSKEEIEDIGLINAMKAGREKDYVSRESVMKKLDSWK
jgi:hypothetical protein